MNLKPNVKVAARASAEARQTLPDEMQDRVRLRARGNVDALSTVEQRRLDADAEDGVDDVDRFGVVQVAAASLEARIRGSADDDKEIARRRPRLVTSLRRPNFRIMPTLLQLFFLRGPKRRLFTLFIALEHSSLQCVSRS